MDIAEKVNMYLAANAKYFPEEKIPFLRDKLMTVTEEKLNMITYMQLKNPTVSLLLSIFLGELGIDRFMVDDIGLGILKLLTGGVCGIMWLVDLFLIMGRTRDKNFEKVWAFLQ